MFLAPTQPSAKRICVATGVVILHAAKTIIVSFVISLAIMVSIVVVVLVLVLVIAIISPS